MEIVDLIIEDIPQLAILYKSFWNENSNIDKMKNEFNKLKQNNSYIILCAKENNILIGSVMGIICEELYGDCKPFMIVENMIIDNNYRRKGIGKKIFMELEKRGKEKECTQIILVTETNRKDACNFYESVGFDPIKNKGYKKKI
ncbi:N-acetyltransferase [Bacteroidia bacterium]|nr:N-acetyltransferase [Bacteroidia bacterium]